MFDYSLALIFSTSFIIGFSGAMMPGPLVTMVISESARRGFRAAPLLVAGHSLAELAMVIALAAGLSALLSQNVVAGAVGLLGGGALVWMGAGILQAVRKGQVAMEATGNGRAAQGYVWSGIVASVSNPYWLLWWATVGTTYIFRSMGSGAAGPISFYTGHILSDLVWCCFVAFLIVSGRKMLSQRAYQGILAVCGLFMVGLGGYFFVSGAQFLAPLAAIAL